MISCQSYEIQFIGKGRSKAALYGRLVGLDCSNHRPLKPPRMLMQLSATLISLVFILFV